MVWIATDDVEGSAIWELTKVEDRTAAITAGSILERRLEKSLKLHLYDDEEITRDMFRESGPLGPFGTKIKLGFMIGLYSLDAQKDLKRISKIRNTFAHELWAKSFSINEIKNDCGQLKLVEKHIEEQKSADEIFDPTTWQTFFVKGKDADLADPKMRYLYSVMILSTMLTTLVKSGTKPVLLVPRF
jgi:DNA-binding MltR family transcriptional regulator